MWNPTVNYGVHEFIVLCLQNSNRLFLKTFTVGWVEERNPTNPTVNYGQFGFTFKTAIARF
ncbi:hypothetical protein [Cylindrospermopsis raciborskii]|uniref:hypothetical protein n=1 Tax=Cylindrospermopsis raciborskii TaxID=77022 RepID=UPI001146FB64|nr:hypothetical protein [Cylindrospermopsis raciborskii]